MKCIAIAGLMSIALVSAFADNVTVAGSSTGDFSGVSSGTVNLSGNTWTYSGSGTNKSTLSFTGDTFGFFDQCLFNCITPVTVDLGTLTDTNNGRTNPAQELTGTLSVDVNFTTPTGGSESFPLSIAIDEAFNRSDSDSVLGLGNSDGPSSTFIIDGEDYTVTLDGFFNGPFNSNGPLTSLTTSNDSHNSASLWATITATACSEDPDPVPEPAYGPVMGAISVALLAFSFRKRAKGMSSR